MSLWIKALMASNVFMYRMTGGSLGGQMAGQSVLLLHTVGRKSGKLYTIPVNYYRDGENFILVASNWGKEHHPGWFINLKHQPETTIQVKRQSYTVQASEASGQDYDRLWRYVTGKNEFYERYQKQAGRKIPIVVLTPRS
jgi:deazaflavin-dependent oxidoreductase (nitroreductase family)